MSGSVAFGEAREIQLAQGSIRYSEVGSGEPILLVHGILANGNLWRDVVPRSFRTVGHASPRIGRSAWRSSLSPSSLPGPALRLDRGRLDRNGHRGFSPGHGWLMRDT